ncbi:MarR family transcriptional regulator [Microlunatus elymi]|uniref:MarR family transcriptional regulator n=1 Tax=Microlunatus elymi TaxID=2596828 RepID=A0A516PTV9_9ACTN|nr:MarR family transcriptional regulator [Microlunatus elymi]QDP94617.1 MarR family transcriptional regulator [Microlunatus elymi]
MINSTERSDTAQLAGQLRTVINRLGYHLRQPATREGLTPTRLTALAALEKLGPLRPGDLAAALGVTAPSMSRLVEALTDGGWVSRQQDHHDRRAYLLALSDHGRTTLAGLRCAGTGVLSEGIAELTAAQRATLAAALPVLTELADRHLGSGRGDDPN